MDSAEDKRRLLKGHAFKVWFGRFGKCLAPGDCSNQPIGAHSIQKSGPLDLIAVDGHVMMLCQHHNANAPPTIDYDSVGVGQASVFTGLCAMHDSQMFRHIDEVPLATDDSTALFLHAYRAVLRETHVRIEAGAKLHAVFQKKSGLGLVDSDVPTRDGRIAMEHLLVGYETWLYKEQFDDAYLTEDYSMLQTHVIDLGDTGPTVAVSSLFSVDEIEGGQDVPRIALTVLPLGNGRTYALLSTTTDDQQYLGAWLQPILVAEGDELRRRLSHIIMERCENVAISPRLFASWSQERRDAILSFFAGTLFVNRPFSNDERLDLFHRDTV